LLCGSAPNLSLLVAARFIAGVGGGGILTCASIIMSDLVSLRERGKYQGMGNAVFGSASMVGAPLGGLLADTVGWRWGFWVNLPVGLAAVMTIIWVMEDYSVDTACSLPNNNYADGTESTSHGSVANSSPSLMESSVPVETVSKSTVYHKLKRIDYGGILTLVLGMTGLVLGLTLGGNELDWDDTTVLGSIISGVLLLCAFVYVESYVAVQPIMPISIIRCQTPAACYWINFFSSMTALSSVFLIPLWFQVVIGYSAAQSGAYLVPKIVASSIGSIASGVYMSRTGRYRGLTWICQIFMIVSPAFISWRWSEITPQWEYVIYIVLDGFGFGSILTTTLVAMLASIPRDDIAVASAMSYLFRAAGAVFGVALSQSSLQAVLKWSLERRLAGKGAEADAVIELARKAAASVRDTVPVEYLGDVVGAYSEAIRFGFLVCFGSAVVSIVGGMWMGQHELPDNLPSAEDVD
jgi:MFS family permease